MLTLYHVVTGHFSVAARAEEASMIPARRLKRSSSMRSDACGLWFAAGGPVWCRGMAQNRTFTTPWGNPIEGCLEHQTQVPRERPRTRQQATFTKRGCRVEGRTLIGSCILANVDSVTRVPPVRRSELRRKPAVWLDRPGSPNRRALVVSLAVADSVYRHGERGSQSTARRSGGELPPNFAPARRRQSGCVPSAGYSRQIRLQQLTTSDRRRTSSHREEEGTTRTSRSMDVPRRSNIS